MSIDLVIQNETNLFERWKLKREFFCPDGIIDIESYSKSKIKILLLLKEANAVNETVDFKDFLKNGAYQRKATWENVLRWVYGIQNIEQEFMWQDIENLFITENYSQEYLQSFLFCNLKKIGGTFATNNFDFYEICMQDKDLIIEQLNLYFDNSLICPDFVIAGGSIVTSVFSEFFEITDSMWNSTTRGIYYFEFRPNKFFIDFVHPEVRVPPNHIYYSLIDTIKEIKS